jgi:hypothetical protein
MLSAWPVLPTADVLLFMNEAHAHRRWRRRRSKRRTFEQRLARVAEQVEHSEQYQASLRRVMELGRDFQSMLTEPQRAHWLDLEDALLEHTERVQRAYFEAGIEVGMRSRDDTIEGPSQYRDSQGRDSQGRDSQGRDARADALSMLARLIVALARR